MIQKPDRLGHHPDYSGYLTRRQNNPWPMVYILV
jgi:hypothetical protein